MTGNPVYLISTKGSRRVWPASRGCLRLRDTWSYLRICRRSVLPYTRFCNCLLDYDCVLHIVNFAILYFYINICKYSFPYCGPSRLPGTMMWTILNLHYIRKLSCKYDLFWLSGSGEDFWMTPPHFWDYLPFEEDLALYMYNSEFPIPTNDLCQVWFKLASCFWRRRFSS
jgi:hypothetical protein